MNQPASTRFIWVALALVWFGTFVLWRSDFRFFPFLCNHDPGAALRTDAIMSDGARPGSDFFYPYGLLSLFVPHLFFAVFGRSPIALVSLLALISSCSYAGLAWTFQQFKPTQLGMLLLAGAAGHATWQVTPMYAMETAALIWAVGLRLRGRGTAALVVAAAALFVKMSMASVILAALIGLTILDAIRQRRARALLPLLAAPLTIGVCAGLMITWLDVGAIVGTFDASAGAAMYHEYNFGILREGHILWDPRGHNIFWYLGGIPGPWCVATVTVSLLAARGAYRLLQAGITRRDRDLSVISEEAVMLSGFANLAYIFGFYGPALNGAWYYAWLLLIGVAPSIALAQWHLRDRAWHRRLFSNLGWLSLGALLFTSQYVAVKQFVLFVKDSRVNVGAVSIRPEQARELAETLALGHSTGTGHVAVVARASNFGLVDPTLREGRYWQLLKGVTQKRAVDDVRRLTRESDSFLVTAVDYADLTRVPGLGSLLETSVRLHEGKYFLLLRARPQPGAEVRP